MANKQEMIERYVQFKMDMVEKENRFYQNFGEGSVAQDIIDDLNTFIMNELLEVDGNETESDILLWDFIDWKTTGRDYSKIEHPETGKVIDTVEELMPFLQFKN